MDLFPHDDYSRKEAKKLWIRSVTELLKVEVDMISIPKVGSYTYIGFLIYFLSDKGRNIISISNNTLRLLSRSGVQ